VTAPLAFTPILTSAVLLMVLGLSVLLESATGFGIGIVVAALLFLALSYVPRQAALVALAGLAGLTVILCGWSHV